MLPLRAVILAPASQRASTPVWLPAPASATTAMAADDDREADRHAGEVRTVPHSAVDSERPWIIERIWRSVHVGVGRRVRSALLLVGGHFQRRDRHLGVALHLLARTPLLVRLGNQLAVHPEFHWILGLGREFHRLTPTERQPGVLRALFDTVLEVDRLGAIVANDESIIAQVAERDLCGVGNRCARNLGDLCVE